MWGGFWPYHLEMDSYLATTTVLVGSADTADNYDDLSWWELWQSRASTAEISPASSAGWHSTRSSIPMVPNWPRADWVP